MSNINENQFGREQQSENYLKFRPTYDFEFLKTHLEEEIKKKNEKGSCSAVEIACGSGQLTFKILPLFEKIFAFDVNKKQLDYLEIALMKSQNYDKIKIVQHDCSQIDEILNLEDVKSSSPKFLLIAEAFHWFDFDEFINRFKNGTKDKDITFVVLGYRIFDLIDPTQKQKESFDKFIKKINPFFKFDTELLDKKYQTYDFKKHFTKVEFFEYDQNIIDGDIRNFLGYLDTWSGYRNYLESVKFDPERDPLLELMRDLELRNFEKKVFSDIQVSSEENRKISYRFPTFMYVLNK